MCPVIYVKASPINLRCGCNTISRLVFGVALNPANQFCFVYCQANLTLIRMYKRQTQVAIVLDASIVACGSQTYPSRSTGRTKRKLLENQLWPRPALYLLPAVSRKLGALQTGCGRCFNCNRLSYTYFRTCPLMAHPTTGLVFGVLVWLDWAASEGAPYPAGFAMAAATSTTASAWPTAGLNWVTRSRSNRRNSIRHNFWSLYAVVVVAFIVECRVLISCLTNRADVWCKCRAAQF